MMAEEMVQVFECGQRLCKDGKPHDDDGEGIDEEYEGGGGMSSTTCSRCGSASIDRAMWL